MLYLSIKFPLLKFGEKNTYMLLG